MNNFDVKIYDCALSHEEILNLYLATHTKELNKPNIPISVYPNPFSSYAVFDLRSLPEGEYFFSLSNAQGIPVREIKRPTNREFKVQKRDLPSGIYFYSICNAGEVFSIGKLIIN